MFQGNYSYASKKLPIDFKFTAKSKQNLKNKKKLQYDRNAVFQSTSSHPNYTLV